MRFVRSGCLSSAVLPWSPHTAGTCNLTREKTGNDVRTAKHHSVVGQKNFARASTFVPPLAWHPDC